MVLQMAILMYYRSQNVELATGNALKADIISQCSGTSRILMSDHTLFVTQHYEMRYKLQIKVLDKWQIKEE